MFIGQTLKIEGIGKIIGSHGSFPFAPSDERIVGDLLGTIDRNGEVPFNAGVRREVLRLSVSSRLLHRSRQRLYNLPMTVYATMVLGAILVGGLVYRYDMYEKEPWYMLAGTAALGAATMWLLGYLEDLSLSFFPPPRTSVVIAAVAATHEEFAKLGIVLVIALAIPSQLNDPMDGIIYGSIAGLGMAVEESVFYMSFSNPQGFLLPPSEVVRLVCHPLMGGICGFAIGMKRMQMSAWPSVLAGCMTLSLTFHFLWDWVAFSALFEGDKRWWPHIASALLMLAGILFYGGLVEIASDWSRQVFAPHGARSLWGWPLSLLIKRKHPAHDR